MWPFQNLKELGNSTMISGQALTPRDFISRRDEINKKLKANRQLELRTTLYAYSEESFIICATTGISEAGKPSVLPFNVSNENIGHTIKELLMQTYLHPAPPHTEKNLSDWPAYIASGAKSGRLFEEKSVYVSIQTINTALRIEATRRKPHSEVDIVISHSLNIDNEQLGATVRKLVSIVKFLDSHNVI